MRKPKPHNEPVIVGRIAKLFPDGDYGILETLAGEKVRFHRSRLFPHSKCGSRPVHCRSAHADHEPARIARRGEDQPAARRHRRVIAAAAFKSRAGLELENLALRLWSANQFHLSPRGGPIAFRNVRFWAIHVD